MTKKLRKQRYPYIAHSPRFNEYVLVVNTNGNIAIVYSLSYEPTCPFSMSLFEIDDLDNFPIS